MSVLSMHCFDCKRTSQCDANVLAFPILFTLDFQQAVSLSCKMDNGYNYKDQFSLLVSDNCHSNFMYEMTLRVVSKIP